MVNGSRTLDLEPSLDLKFKLEPRNEKRIYINKHHKKIIIRIRQNLNPSKNTDIILNKWVKVWGLGLEQPSKTANGKVNK